MTVDQARERKVYDIQQQGNEFQVVDRDTGAIMAWFEYKAGSDMGRGIAKGKAQIRRKQLMEAKR